MLLFCLHSALLHLSLCHCLRIIFDDNLQFQGLFRVDHGFWTNSVSKKYSAGWTSLSYGSHLCMSVKSWQHSPSRLWSSLAQLRYLWYKPWRLSSAFDVEAYNREDKVVQAEWYALIHHVWTSAGAEQFVQSVVHQTILSSNCDWGALLSSAPRALCHMRQCFVVASSPLAASLKLSDRARLQYVWLRLHHQLGLEQLTRKCQ